MSTLLPQLRAMGALSALDEQLARTLCLLCDERDERVLLAAALVSRQVTHGHVCLPLPELVRGELSVGDDGETLLMDWPEQLAWLAALRQSPLCGSVPGETTPLVLDDHARLYLRRHFEHERALARDIRERAAHALEPNRERIARRLTHYFGNEPNDLQRKAAELALSRAFCVISGGPGTGKTSTVVKILALVIEEAAARAEPPMRIALVAPTGKAAVRLETAVRSAKLALVCDERVRESIPDNATTIHRALRARAREGRATQPAQLSLDLLLVDEASMVDLELMTELLHAVPAQARVILLGDRHQLASVEAGAVLGDICGAGAQEQASTLAASVIELTRSYRYAADSGIGELARAIQAGDAERALALFDDGAYPDVRLVELPEHGLSDELATAIVSGYAPYLEAEDPRRALELFDGFRVLCAHRRGEQGVETLNRWSARLLYERGLIDRSDGNFIGRPLLITENDYRNRLWNGDVGLVVRSASGAPAACFVASDGQARELGFSRLPPHQSAFALSVHKSQGSEVDEVALVLPSEPSRVLTRELLYTAVTRAKKRVIVHGSRKVVRWAISHRVARSTGLRELLT